MSIQKSTSHRKTRISSKNPEKPNKAKLTEKEKSLKMKKISKKSYRTLGYRKTRE